MSKSWVTATDSHMSGWGKAKNKLNKLIFECDTNEEARIVMDNLRCRPEMKYINHNIHRPVYHIHKYLVTYIRKSDEPNWYTKDYFKGVRE